MKCRRFFAAALLVCFLSTASYSTFAGVSGARVRQIAFVEKFFRTELYFGLNKPDGSEVSEEDWSKFLADEVTPRFPDGFTVLESFGQFRDAAGKIVKEKSRCLILLYSKKDRRANNKKIEQIRASYKQNFQQESVLRLDFRQTVNISF